MFNFSVIAFFVTLLFLVVAVFYDVRYRIIPNFLIVTMLVFSIIFAVFQSIYFSSWNYLINLLVAVFITFAVAFVFWLLGVFAGGDLKLFVGISALNPLPPIILATSFYNSSVFPIFALVLIIVSIFATLPYLLGLLTCGILSKKYTLNLDVLLQKQFWKSSILSILTVFAISSFATLLSVAISPILLFAASFLILFALSAVRKINRFLFESILCVIYILLAIVAISVSKFYTVFSVINFIEIALFILVIDLILVLHRNIKARLLRQATLISKLHVGDVLVNNYYYSKNKIVVVENTFFNMINQLLKGTYYKNLRIDASRASGLEKNDITFLKRMYKNRLIGKKIDIKMTIPFTPSVLIGYLFLALIGGLLCVIF